MAAAGGMAVLLGGCGFRPVYARREEQGDAVEQLNLVAVDNIPNRTGQVLRNLLIDRLYTTGRPAAPLYRLSVALTARERKLGIRKDATATRAQLTLTARYALLDKASGEALLRTASHSVVSYNILESQYGTLVTEEDAYERALTQISEEISTRLALYFTRPA